MDNKLTCKYIFVKGKNSGQTCPTKIKEGKEFCSKHTKKEAMSILASNSSSTTSSRNRGKKTVEQPINNAIKFLQKAINGNKTVIMLSKNSDGAYEHSETGFIINPKTKKVYAKKNEAGLLPLSIEDIETCKQWNFSYEIFEELSFEDQKLQEIREKEREEIINEKRELDDNEQSEDDDDAEIN